MSRSTRTVLLLWLPVLAWMILILIVSSIPRSDMPEIAVPNIDKMAHVAEYSILGFLLIRAVSNSFRNISLAKIVFSAIIVASLFAFLDEWYQRYIPGRVCNILDFIADFIGANIGILIYRKKG